MSFTILNSRGNAGIYGQPSRSSFLIAAIMVLVIALDAGVFLNLGRIVKRHSSYREFSQVIKLELDLTRDRMCELYAHAWGEGFGTLSPVRWVLGCRSGA